MTLDPERMKALIAFKKRLENQLEALNSEIKETQVALDIVNSMLLEKGFKRGDLKEIPPPNLPKEVALPKQEYTNQALMDTRSQITPRTTVGIHHDIENVFPLKNVNDETLALICFDKDVIRVLPDESKKFNAKTPPFQNFLLEKVLTKMKEKDEELVRNNQLEVNKAFAYNVITEEDSIQEIVIHNVDDERLKELKSSIRWTLEKMYEKMKS
ncbi:MAG: hypothetical protein FWB84_02330 [Candidatus Bathyarchaeota archaeon]|uniref:hypothetical protein n=1 Tax=Candidatus Bathycorpusculum sp. TaxID=2994959 RepID=UPI00281A9290|nr:hypothetical protein [Candidatus Termiticorpusculum sp.]MCL2257405.1 hypothetical protein [Candidatus Termiticorpusculum sp.]MCL2292444.1 hypothetical protein [Candidatus Termiticorpusculum sp.]